MVYDLLWADLMLHFLALQNELGLLKNSNEEKSEQIVEQERDLSRYRSTLLRSDAAMVGLNNIIVEVKTEKEKFSQLCASLEEKVKQKEEQLAKKSKECANVKEDLELHSRRSHMKEQQNKQLQTEIEEVKKDMGTRIKNLEEDLRFERTEARDSLTHVRKFKEIAGDDLSQARLCLIWSTLRRRESRPCRLSKTKDNCAKMQSKTSRLSSRRMASAWTKTAVAAEAKRKEEVLSAEVHRLETEVSQMKSELHNAKEEIQMAQSLHNEKDNSAREMQAKFDNVEAERIKAVQASKTKDNCAKMQSKTSRLSSRRMASAWTRRQQLWPRRKGRKKCSS